MSLRLWRISEFDDLSGRGGLLASARWNTRGHAVVYTAESSAGALSELLVHLDRDLIPPDFQLLTLEADPSVSILDAPRLPANWKLDHTITRKIGDEWLSSERSALFRVPSAIVTHAYNVLINPLHPDSSQIKIVARERLEFDRRLK